MIIRTGTVGPLVILLTAAAAAGARSQWQHSLLLRCLAAQLEYGLDHLPEGTRLLVGWIAPPWKIQTSPKTSCFVLQWMLMKSDQIQDHHLLEKLYMLKLKSSPRHFMPIYLWR